MSKNHWRNKLPAKTGFEYVEYFRVLGPSMGMHGKLMIFACVVGVEYDGLVYVGISFCDPKDNFCRRIAREVARGRALKALALYQKQGTTAQDIHRWSARMTLDGLQSLRIGARKCESNLADAYLMKLHIEESLGIYR